MFFSFCSSRIEPIAGLTDSCSMPLNIAISLSILFILDIGIIMEEL